LRDQPEEFLCRWRSFLPRLLLLAWRRWHAGMHPQLTVNQPIEADVVSLRERHEIETAPFLKFSELLFCQPAVMRDKGNACS
jgi:hypothetical protein